VLEVGPGCFRFAWAALRANLAISAVELPIARATGFRLPEVPTWYAWRPFPLPWPVGAFDVAYQRNAVPNMPSDDVLPALRELARVAHRFVWSGDFRCRFGCGVGEAWMRERLADVFTVDHEDRKLLILTPR